jgi:HK97 family phage major capsid protein
MGCRKTQVSATLPRFRSLEFSAKKLICLCYGTTELFDDVPMLDAHMHRVFGAEMGFKLDLAVLAGGGAGMPLGILNSTALITVGKETGQASATINRQNIAKMWVRLPAPSRKTAVWLVHEDVEAQLDNLNVAGDGNATMFVPAGVHGNEYPLLKGRPCIAVEQCSALGTLGDIVLADLGHYIIIEGGVRAVLSAEVRFLNDEVIWKFVLRVDGASAFAGAITPYTGSSTRSPFVALATR